MDKEDIDLLLQTAQRWFADHSPLDERVARFREGHHPPPQAWAEMAELGWLALTLPEDLGGLGAGTDAAFGLMRLAGRDARPEPLGLHLLLAPYVARHATELAQPLMEGEMRLAMAEPLRAAPGAPRDASTCSGEVSAIYGVEGATHLLVPTGRASQDDLVLVSLAHGGVSLTPARLVDGRSTHTARLDNVPCVRVGRAAEGLDLAAAAQVADATGSLEYAFEFTLDYLKQRVQFGRPLSSQQTIQHKMAEVLCDLQQMQALSRRLAAELQSEPSGPWPTLPAAKAFVGRRALRAMGVLIQLSGGIGVTEEYRLTHLYRRMHVAAQLFGAPEYQLGRLSPSRSLLSA
ncbi:acyl-CoA dehydrogenase family protein [Caldimonas thermodepolymerans]|uniref:acyl-CoA dehydrogenase family protein n=1 Tax=Caldimonas thermodepolymerans TaxID=215580 RepID=UPI002235BCED|nr:acyl-CoA dehydrogenase family protein [Caldimonas thermodepolymerans]UZG44405.1 acyl-CoA/acyl-ACP dehydrogenase [Caldimonas thermodepolymerans]